jgi:hypothetical protein
LILVSIWAFLAFVLISRIDLNKRATVDVDLENALKQLNDTLLALGKIKENNENLNKKISDYIR